MSRRKRWFWLMGIRRRTEGDGMILGEAGAIVGSREADVVRLPDRADLEHSWKVSRMRSLTHLTASVHLSCHSSASSTRPSLSPIIYLPARPTCAPPASPPLPMPCFVRKRPASPPLAPLLGASRASGPPPHKRMKIIHPSDDILSDLPSGDRRRSPAAALRLLSITDRECPLTKCHAARAFANAVYEPREHDVLSTGMICPDTHQAPERMPQTLLSCSASHQLLHKEAQRVSKSAVVSATPCAHATPEDGCYKSSGDALAPRSSARPFQRSLCPPSAALPMACNFVPHPGPSTYPSNQSAFSNNKAPSCGDPLLTTSMASYDADFLNYLYEGLDKIPYEFSDEAYDFPAGDQLSEVQEYEAHMSPPNMRSPIFRSMSRSSFGSCEYMASASPGDYPTPASDNSVTTPAPSEVHFGWLPELRHPLFGQEVPCGLEAGAKGELECSYVRDFPGSAPLSPNAFLTCAFDVSKPEAVNEGSGLTGARRHSEPANLAALQFPLFFEPQIPPPSSDATTLPIADNLASSSSAAAPSSIAPHQTQLPRPLEIMQPKPVRAYKPPILRGDLCYDPKDFVRRHSEPILPLRELDVFSHLPTDISENAAEETDDEMMFEGAEELYDVEDSFSDSSDGAPMQGMSLDGLEMRTLSGADEGEPLFNPEWSWIQPAPQPPIAPQSWCGAEMFDNGIDWTAAFAIPSVPGPSFAPRLDGSQLL